MKKIFLAYNQNVTLKIDMIRLDVLPEFRKAKKVELVLTINKAVTPSQYQIKREIINPDTFQVYNKSLVHYFPVNEYRELERPILGNLWDLEIYINNKCVLSKSRAGGILCERKRFVEKTIADYLDFYLNYQVRFFSGPNHPDLIIKDVLCNSEIQCEITEKTNSDQELTYEKFSRDMEKYLKYKREDRFPNVKHLLLIPCAAGISSSISKHQQDYITILTFNDLYNLLYSLQKKQDQIINVDKVKNIITNPGIQKAPRIYEKKITPYNKNKCLQYSINLEAELAQGLGRRSNTRPILFIRDISPYEVIKIVEISKIYDKEFRSKEKFKEILFKDENLKVISKGRLGIGLSFCKDRIKGEEWLITPIQLGYLDENCKVKDKGLFLLELRDKLSINKNEVVLIRKSMGYDFLNSAGIKDFLKLVHVIYREQKFKKNPKKKIFIELLYKKMIENGLSSSEREAKENIGNIFRWLNLFGYCNEIFLNIDRIREDYTLEENDNERIE